MASIAADVKPVPVESRNFKPITLLFQLTPVTPSPLLPAAPIVPATWVPCR